MTDGVSISEFARVTGISRTMVQKLIKAGTIPQYMDGTIPLEAGLAAYEEYKKAPKSKGGRPRKSAYAKTVVKPEKNTHEQPDKTIDFYAAKAKQEIHTPKVDIPKIHDTGEFSSNDKAERQKEAVSINAALNKVKLAKEARQTEKIDIEVKRLKGELLEKAEVAKEAQWLAEQVKAKLMAIPPSISSMCEGRIARDIEEIITDAINNALKELQKCKYTGGQE